MAGAASGRRRPLSIQERQAEVSRECAWRGMHYRGGSRLWQHYRSKTERIMCRLLHEPGCISGNAPQSSHEAGIVHRMHSLPVYLFGINKRTFLWVVDSRSLGIRMKPIGG